MAKIVPILVRGGFIATSRGRTGGLRLARPPEEIGIGDVIRVTEATHVEAECVGGTTLPCGIKRAAPINRMLGDALEAFIEFRGRRPEVHALLKQHGILATGEMAA